MGFVAKAADVAAEMTPTPDPLEGKSRLLWDTELPLLLLTVGNACCASDELGSDGVIDAEDPCAVKEADDEVLNGGFDAARSILCVCVCASTSLFADEKESCVE